MSVTDIIRVTEDDGSKWVNADAFDAAISALKWAMDRIDRACPHKAVEGDAALYEFATARAIIREADGREPEGPR